jgi:hypothetical protein
MLDALRKRLLEKSRMYQDKMAVFLYDEFEVLVNSSAVSRALASIGWTKKTTRQVAKERNADLWDYYLHNLSAFQSHHLVYVDESGCDRCIGLAAKLDASPMSQRESTRQQKISVVGERAELRHEERKKGFRRWMRKLAKKVF